MFRMHSHSFDTLFTLPSHGHRVRVIEREREPEKTNHFCVWNSEHTAIWLLCGVFDRHCCFHTHTHTRNHSHWWHWHCNMLAKQQLLGCNCRLPFREVRSHLYDCTLLISAFVFLILWSLICVLSLVSVFFPIFHIMLLLLLLRS